MCACAFCHLEDTAEEDAEGKGPSRRRRCRTLAVADARERGRAGVSRCPASLSLCPLSLSPARGPQRARPCCSARCAGVGLPGPCGCHRSKLLPHSGGGVSGTSQQCQSPGRAPPSPFSRAPFLPIFFPGPCPLSSVSSLPSLQGCCLSRSYFFPTSSSPFLPAPGPEFFPSDPARGFCRPRAETGSSCFWGLGVHPAEKDSGFQRGGPQSPRRPSLTQAVSLPLPTLVSLFPCWCCADQRRNQDPSECGVGAAK